jgi:hypothetical protein
MKKMILSAALMAMCVSCGGQGGQKNKNSATDSTIPSEPTVVYRAPAVPAMLTSDEERGQWAAQHYWDNFNFADTLDVVQWSKYAEQAFVDFTHQLLIHVPIETAGRAFETLFRKAAVNRVVFDKFAGTTEKYLFESNSPLYNENLYIAALKVILADPALNEWERIRPEGQLRIALRNRPGDPAGDFRYTLESGATGTLYTLRSPYTMLFFNNPGCPACRTMIDQIVASPFLSEQIAKGTLTALAIYTDADLDAWRAYLAEMPAGWICSYDAGEVIKNNEIYDLKAIPTLYLLDRNKRVMLKDEMSIPRLEQTLYNEINK